MNYHPSPRDRAAQVVRSSVELLAYRIAADTARALDADGLLCADVHVEGRAVRAEAKVARALERLRNERRGHGGAGGLIEDLTRILEG